MAAATEEMTITYAGETFGGSSARKIDNYTRDEQTYPNGYFEFEFVTTAATDAAFITELDAVRAAFRKPRQDLVVTQNGSNYLVRKHSDNSGLDTNPVIIKDGDPADTGRSHHFRIRIEYELPADNLSTNFRRGATITVEFSPSRRRTVTITGIYTANSTDGTTKSRTQYLAQIGTYEEAELDNISTSAVWERVGTPREVYFETDKVIEFTRVYREVNINQAIGTVDHANIIDPHLEITVEQEALDDSFEPGIVLGGGQGAGGGGQTISLGIGGPGGTVAGAGIKRPIVYTATYDAAINFAEIDLQGVFDNTIRPWIQQRVKAYSFGQTLVEITDGPGYEEYENRIRATLRFLSYSATILSQRIGYKITTVDGKVFKPTTSNDVFEYYEYQGPAVRELTVTETREQIVAQGTTARQHTLDRMGEVGGAAAVLGPNWVKVSRTPGPFEVRTKGFSNNTKVTIAYGTIETVFRFRKKKPPSVANAGGVTGSTVTA